MIQCRICASPVTSQSGFCPDCGSELDVPDPGAAAGSGSELPTTQAAPIPGWQAAPPPGATSPPPGATSPPPSATSPPTAQRATVQGRIQLRRQGKLTSDVFTFTPPVTIGRFDPDLGPVDIDLGPLPESAYISRQHAEIWREANGSWRVRDLGAKSGCFVRPQGASQFTKVAGVAAISSGDEFALGNVRFEFHEC